MSTLGKRGYYLAGGALAACGLAVIAGFDGGVGPAPAPRVAGASLADAGGLLGAESDGGGAPAAAGQARPAIVDSFPVEPVIPGWSDVHEREISSRLTRTFAPAGITVAGVECRQRSCYIDMQGPDVGVMMAARDAFFATLSGLSVRTCQFGSRGLDEATRIQRLYLYCRPGASPNFEYFDGSRSVRQSMERLEATLGEIRATEEGGA